MPEKKTWRPDGPDMGRVEDGLFKVVSGMAKVLGELRPDEMRKLGPHSVVRMSSVWKQTLNGGVEPNMDTDLEKIRKLREIFDRAATLK